MVASKSNELIEFECEEWSREEIEDHVESPVTYIKVLDKGRDYVTHMSDPIITFPPCKIRFLPYPSPLSYLGVHLFHSLYLFYSPLQPPVLPIKSLALLL